MNIEISIQGETLNLTEGLLGRYNVPGPRYTSYPTAPEWSDAFGPADYERALSASGSVLAGLLIPPTAESPTKPETNSRVDSASYISSADL